MKHSINFLLTLTICASLITITPTQAQLSRTFYDTSCPSLVNIVRSCVQQAVAVERRMAASIIRLHFHDCFVQGCDASILLDESPTIQSEKTAAPNNNSVRGYDVIENIKREVERVCPRTVSCADILTIAAREASVAVNGCTWNLRLGRRDSTTANRTQANTDLPSPFASLQVLNDSFARKGLDATDLVALSGAHSIGVSRCFLFRTRIYSNGTDIDPSFATARRYQCPPTGGDSNLTPLDLVTPDALDNYYFKNLIQRKGLLQSDQILFSAGGPTSATVNRYSNDPVAFAREFAIAMVKMSEIGPLLLGTNGIIRRVCNATS